MRWWRWNAQMQSRVPVGEWNKNAQLIFVLTPVEKFRRENIHAA